MTQNKLFTIKEALTFGWETFKKDPWFFVGATIGLSVFSLVIEALTSDGRGLWSLIGFLISLVASAVITIAYARLALSAADGAHVDWHGLWAPEHFLNMLGAIVIQSVIIIVGFVLLIVPGIIASLLLAFTQLALVDKKLTPIEALKESYRLTKGHLWDLFLFAIVLLLINLAGLIALVVGLLVTVPVTLIAVAYVYKKFKLAQEPTVVIPVGSAQ